MNKEKPMPRLPLLLLPLLLMACATAPVPGTPGMVYDDEGRPLSGVDVSAKGQWLARTDINGRFFIGALPKAPEGSTLGRKLDFQKDGFESGQVDLDSSDPLPNSVVYMKMPSRDQLLKLTWAALDRGDFTQAAQLLERSRLLGREDAFWALTKAALLLLDPTAGPEELRAFLPGLLSGKYGELPDGWKDWWTRKLGELKT